jgi:predicted polyphosphate/ATP-dependent NAD kinase
VVASRLKDEVQVITYPHEMGEDSARNAGMEPVVIGSIRSGETTPDDTLQAAKEMAEMGVDLILFAGGDGTARNIYTAVGSTIPVLGIPAGVKIHSAVYAVNPRSAGEVAALYLEGKVVNIKESEVMDIDENAFREGVVTAKLYGFMMVPEEKRFVQSVKSGGAHSEQVSVQGIAAEVVNNMEPDVVYIIGPGTTTRSIMDRLSLPNTLLGVDVVVNKQLVASDVTESQLLELLKDEKAKIVVTVIGGQGHIFGRGNQQLSPRILRAVGKKNVTVIASKEKLISLSGRPLLVDTGDEELNQELSGYIPVITGFEERVMYKVGY